MDLKEKLVSSFIAFENQVDIDSWSITKAGTGFGLGNSKWSRMWN